MNFKVSSKELFAIAYLSDFCSECNIIGDDGPLFQAIAALEYALEHSKFNFQFKLLLIRLHIKLGKL